MTAAPTALWVLIAALAVTAFTPRASFILPAGRFDGVPDGLERPLRYVPAAVFAALVAPAVLAPEGRLLVTPGNERLLAGIVGAVVAARTRSVLWTVVAGMGTLWFALFVG